MILCSDSCDKIPPVEIPLTAADLRWFSREPNAADIINSQIADAYDRATEGDWSGGLQIRLYIGGNGAPRIFCTGATSAVCFAWLTDKEIDLLIDFCFRHTEQPQRVSKDLAAVIERYKRDQLRTLFQQYMK